MHERYKKPEIERIWSDENKLGLWQLTELAVLEARKELGELESSVTHPIKTTLQATPIDIPWWKARDKEVGHDLNAFIDERRRHLPAHLQSYFHEKMTSYDTEEPAFARVLKDSSIIILEELEELMVMILNLARKYRYTPMIAHTHGQWAELQTFGKVCLQWYTDLILGLDNLRKSTIKLVFSKLSGAIGNYGAISPELERKALEILGLKPYYGATQIMPRELYVPVAVVLCQIVCTLNKIATAIRLGARSGNPIYQEPFGRKQKGSSRMPQKKNTIKTEQVKGMERMARGYFGMIMENIETWEERAIEQSCVERVAWPDLFHVTLHSLQTMHSVIKNLQVFPDNMLLEIIETRGTYAAGDAKDFIGRVGASMGIKAEDAYRIVQLASFCVFAPASWRKWVRENLSTNEQEMDKLRLQMVREDPPEDIEDLIRLGHLRPVPELDIQIETIAEWNILLKVLFQHNAVLKEWRELFSFSRLLRNERILFE